MQNPISIDKLQNCSTHCLYAFKPARLTKARPRSLLNRCRAKADASTVEPDVADHSALRAQPTPLERDNTVVPHSQSPAHGDTLLISPAAERELGEALLAANGELPDRQQMSAYVRHGRLAASQSVIGAFSNVTPRIDDIRCDL